MHHPTDRITHTMAFVTPVVEHWLEREIAQWVPPMLLCNGPSVLSHLATRTDATDACFVLCTNKIYTYVLTKSYLIFPITKGSVNALMKLAGFSTSNKVKNH